MKNIENQVTHNSRKVSKGIALVAVLAIAASLMACSSGVAAKTTTAATTAVPAVTSKVTASTSAAAATAAEKTFTVDQLAKYDGQNGNPAYIAVDGIVYDVSAIRAWKDGIHQGQYKAGLDYTDLIKQSPHGTKVLDQAVKVGVMAS